MRGSRNVALPITCAKAALQAFDVVEQITGEPSVHTIGYCVGGTLLAIALAYLAAKGQQDRVKINDPVHRPGRFYARRRPQGVRRRRGADRHVGAADGGARLSRGQEDGECLQLAALQRPDLALRDKQLSEGPRTDAVRPSLLEFGRDLDAEGQPLIPISRRCYLENTLAKGELELAGEHIDLKRITVPTYNLATREDHIAPARSAYYGSSFLSGPVRFVLAGSGHIAGVVNPPYKQKYQHWTGGPPQGDDLEKWLASAEEHPGSWWPDWITWIKAQDAEETEAHVPGGGKFEAIEDAPGSYVRVRGGSAMWRWRPTP